MSAITYRITDSMEDLQQAEHLQQVVWGMTPEDTLGATTMRWMIHIGGLLIGAWDDDKMIGFCIASVGKRDNQWVLWSDMAGIHPDYQGQGIGYSLKQKQKSSAYEQGYPEIRWTFDPMRSGNAAFNFHKLGVTSYQYHNAFYGEMSDDINRGLPADRLEAIWRTSEDTIKSFDLNPTSLFAVKIDGLKIQEHHVTSPQVKIEIPLDLDKLKADQPALAKKWQQAIRNAFTYYFKSGYAAVDFWRDSEKSWYILHKIS